jgi:ABC-type protease/lipase transport system fused ATPase/permease subunit
MIVTLENAAMFSDPPRRILAILSTLLSVLFLASLIYSEQLPDRMLGLNKLFCHAFLFLGAMAASSGGRLLDWLRRRNIDR